MEKNKKKDNTLIKRRNLVLLLKKAGINRISKQALEEIEIKARENLEKMAVLLKQTITIKGKKTLEKPDILDLKQDETFWEV